MSNEEKLESFILDPSELPAKEEIHIPRGVTEESIKETVESIERQFERHFETLGILDVFVAVDVLTKKDKSIEVKIYLKEVGREYKDMRDKEDITAEIEELYDKLEAAGLIKDKDILLKALDTAYVTKAGEIKSRIMLHDFFITDIYDEEYDIIKNEAEESAAHKAECLGYKNIIVKQGNTKTYHFEIWGEHEEEREE